MPKLLLFGGTTEARELLERGIPALCCVATDYGAERAGKASDVRVGRLDEAGMTALIQEEGITCAIDATHPYAAEATKNIRAACEKTGTPLLRVSRPATETEGADITRVGSCREAAELLDRRPGNALLTVGSKELHEFIAVRDYAKRLFVRVLPTSEALALCEGLGFDPGHVLAMCGPFSLEMNRAMLRSTGASLLVTKDGGAAGGMAEKLRAAQEMGAEVILVTRPGKEQEVHTVEEGVLWARRHLGLPRPPLFPLLLDLEGRDVLVIGGGAVALRRAGTLLRCGARVRAVSPAFCDGFPRDTARIQRPFQAEDLEGAVLAVAASDSREVNQRAAREAKRRGIPVSVADAAGSGSFFFPALVASGGAAASVSTAGLSCAATRRLADRLRAVWDDWVRDAIMQEGGVAP